jgi:hypothetical protein
MRGSDVVDSGVAAPGVAGPAAVDLVVVGPGVAARGAAGSGVGSAVPSGTVAGPAPDSLVSVASDRSDAAKAAPGSDGRSCCPGKIDPEMAASPTTATNTSAAELTTRRRRPGRSRRRRATEYESRAVVPRPESAHAEGVGIPALATAGTGMDGATVGSSGRDGTAGTAAAAGLAAAAGVADAAGVAAAAGVADGFGTAACFAGTAGVGGGAASTLGGADPSGVARVQAPQSAQKARLGRLAAPQLQHSPTAADVARTGLERAGRLGRSGPRPSDGSDAAAAAADADPTAAAVDEGRPVGRLDGMGAPASSRRTVADDTSESHSPQNAVTASMGAPHV